MLPQAAVSIDVPPFAAGALPGALPGAAVPAAAFASGAGCAGADLRLAQLLCARVCHDLIGAAGAIETGVDLLAEDGADRADICDLIGLSGRQLSRRLAFYRLAFGMTGRAGDTRPLAEAKRLAEGFLDGGRVVLRWRVDGEAARNGALGTDETRLLLCAILVAAEGLLRGGTLGVGMEREGDATTLVIDGEGKGAAIGEAARAALTGGGAGPEAVTARTVPAYYLGLQRRALAAHLDLDEGPGCFRLRIRVPRA
jgi:histidine phosphotransferase ChpT